MRTLDAVKAALGCRRDEAVKICHFGVSSHLDQVFEEQIIVALSVTRFTIPLLRRPEKAAERPNN
jgi:hypothetical protein